MKADSIGLLELNSIAAGMQIVDAVLKAAQLELILARTICSGKYLIIVSGDVAAVTAGIESGTTLVEGAVIDRCIIPRVHPAILPAMSGASQAAAIKSLGIIESFSVAALLEAADIAAKAANVAIVEIRLAMALGGKAFVILTGDVSAVIAAVDAGAAVVAEKGLLVNKAVIAKPEPGLYRDYI
ncbi:BMC domain-containing protein [candidate division KSB1 bacterium]|nr:BMC domain-containing protein [candidate division KSB1 bacterium]RQW10481.1 MAG: BMC domain-containing protein [candidate division KSB1 bacterium]